MPAPELKTIAAGSGTVRVWDRFVRLFHWSLVSLFVLAYASHDGPDALHQGAGYGVLVLVALRIGWGFVGPEHARFRSFVFGPRAVAAFLRDTLRLRARRYIGHNPAGGAMALALTAMILMISATGIMQAMTAFWGQKWVEEAHELAVHGTVGLIVLHVLGVIVASLEHRENLVRAMITGRKRAEPEG